MPEKEISPTVYGVETEYSLMLTFPDDVIYEIVGSCHSKDTELELYLEPSEAGSEGLNNPKLDEALQRLLLRRNGSGFLSNGGRMYFDPSGIEYATPETTTAEEAVHRTYEGDRILLGALDYLRLQGIIDGYQANRRIVDHNRSSRGIHLNTSTNMTSDPSDSVVQKLASLNIAKGAIFGSGGLLLEEDGTTAFHHSPRLSLTNAYNSSSYTHRPLVRVPFKSEVSGICRIETVSGDALNFAWPLRASMVVTNALVKLIEIRKHGDFAAISTPLFAAQEVGKYGNGHIITVADRYDQEHDVRPVEVIRAVCETALLTDEVEGHLDKESKQVLQEIIDVSDKISNDITSVANQVESVARYYAIEQKMTESKAGIDSEKICRFDYFWDKIGGGLAETLRQRGKVGWQGFSSKKSITCSDKEMTVPPKDTRAYVRGGIIAKTGGKEVSDWDKIKVQEDDIHLVPLATKLPDYAEMEM